MLVETGFCLECRPDTVRAPDVSFILRERIPESGLPEGYFPGAPDLAVEIVSPGDLDREVQDKVSEYLAAGTKRVWVLRHRARTLTVHRADGTARAFTTKDTLTSDEAGFAVAGFSLPLRDLFEA